MERRTQDSGLVVLSPTTSRSVSNVPHEHVHRARYIRVLLVTVLSVFTAVTTYFLPVQSHRTFQSPQRLKQERSRISKRLRLFSLFRNAAFPAQRKKRKLITGPHENCPCWSPRTQQPVSHRKGFGVSLLRFKRHDCPCKVQANASAYKRRAPGRGGRRTRVGVCCSHCKELVRLEGQTVSLGKLCSILQIMQVRKRMILAFAVLVALGLKRIYRGSRRVKERKGPLNEAGMQRNQHVRRLAVDAPGDEQSRFLSSSNSLGIPAHLQNIFSSRTGTASPTQMVSGLSSRSLLSVTTPERAPPQSTNFSLASSPQLSSPLHISTSSSSAASDLALTSGLSDALHISTDSESSLSCGSLPSVPPVTLHISSDSESDSSWHPPSDSAHTLRRSYSTASPSSHFPSLFTRWCGEVSSCPEIYGRPPPGASYSSGSGRRYLSSPATDSEELAVQSDANWNSSSTTISGITWSDSTGSFVGSSVASSLLSTPQSLSSNFAWSNCSGLSASRMQATLSRFWNLFSNQASSARHPQTREEGSLASSERGASQNCHCCCLLQGAATLLARLLSFVSRLH